MSVGYFPHASPANDVWVSTGGGAGYVDGEFLRAVGTKEEITAASS